LSDRSSEAEYFGPHALYVNPADLDGACAAIEAARKDAAREDRRRFVRETHCFKRYSLATAAIYESVSASVERPVSRDLPTGSIYFDVTDYVHSRGQSIGIGKVQEQFYRALRESKTHRLVPVCWAHGTERFHCLTDDEVHDWRTAERLRQRADDDPTVLTNRITTAVDTFFSASGAWVSAHEYYDALVSLSFSTDLRLNLVVHDLVRHDLSHLYNSNDTDRFRQRLSDLAARIDRFFVYSDATASALGRFMRQSPEIGLGISRFPLGIARASGRHGLRPQSEHVVRLANRSFMLFVGSIEPRKNHSLLLNAWKTMIALSADDPPLLVFAGAPRGAQSTVSYWLSCNPDVAEHVVQIEDATDDTVRWLYENCVLTLFPSLYEGWGLPVSESLLYGKICLASDRSSIREIAPDLTELLDPFDALQWAQRVRYWHSNPVARAEQERKIRENYAPPNWSDSVDTVVAALDATGPRQRRWRTELDTRTLVGADALQFRMMGPPIGFHEIESTGVWTSLPTACFKFDIPFPTGADLWLALKIRTLVEDDVGISVNGGAPHSFRVQPADKVITLPVHRQGVSGTATLWVAGSVGTLHSPRDLRPPPSEDARALGVFLVGFGVFTSPERACDVWRDNDGTPARNRKPARRRPFSENPIIKLLRTARLIK
jgi:glycosyltransferase involved in cell wall biosynthesis